MDFNTESKPHYEKRASLIEQHRELIDKAEKEERAFSAEEKTQMEELEEGIEEKTEKIDALRKSYELTEGEEARIAEIAEDNETDPDKVKDEEKEYSRVFWKYMLQPNREMTRDILTDEERKILVEGEKRQQSVGTDSEGGFLSPQEFSNELAIALKAFGGMREASRTITTARGGTMDWPLNDPTANSGEWLAENTDAATKDEVYGNIQFSAHKASSKFIKVSVELMQDAFFDMAGHVRDRLVERIGRLTNTAFTSGDGSAKPRGMLQLPSSTHTGTNEGVESASTTALSGNEIIDLQEALDIAYATNAKFMFHQSTRKLVRKLKDSEGVYIWQPGLRASEPDMLLGKPYIINNDMPELAAGNKIMVYGDFSNYIIRTVRGFTLLRLNERFAEKLQIGFIGFERVDGGLVAANSGAQNPLQHYRITNT